MGIVYAGLSPHAPILLPQIGRGHRRRVQDTIEGLESLCQELTAAEPEIFVLITPHGPMQSEKLTLFSNSTVQGSFASFGYPGIALSLSLAQDLNERLLAEARAYLSPLYGGEPDFLLDHGALVPLYFLQEAGLDTPMTLLSMGALEYQELFDFGRLLATVCEGLGKKTAILASGDLSHRLTSDAPAGFSPKGEEFDQKVYQALLQDDRKALLQLDPDLIMKAGECGLRPLLVLMGAISQLPFSGKIFSYEGPFGVGYLVAGFVERDEHV